MCICVFVCVRSSALYRDFVKHLGGSEAPSLYLKPLGASASNPCICRKTTNMQALIKTVTTYLFPIEGQTFISQLKMGLSHIYQTYSHQDWSALVCYIAHTCNDKHGSIKAKCCGRKPITIVNVVLLRYTFKLKLKWNRIVNFSYILLNIYIPDAGFSFHLIYTQVSICPTSFWINRKLTFCIKLLPSTQDGPIRSAGKCSPQYFLL